MGVLDLSDHLEVGKKILKGMREANVPLIGQMVAFHDGMPRMTCLVHDVRDRDNFFQVAAILGSGLDADALLWLSDAWKTTSITKTDGSDWEPGDMQYAVEHNTPDAKFISENLVVLLVDRIGNAAATSIAYEMKNGKVVFGEVFGDEIDGNQMDSWMKNAFVHVMTKIPPISDRMKEMGVDLSEWDIKPEEAYLVQMCALVKGPLAQTSSVPAVIVSNEWEHDKVAASFAEDGIRDVPILDIRRM